MYLEVKIDELNFTQKRGVVMNKNRSQVINHSFSIVVFLMLMTVVAVSTARAATRDVGVSPWGAADEIGRLNLITPESQAKILSRVDGRTAYDLSVEYFIGMPSWEAAGDPHYQIWMTHTPKGTVVDDPLHVGHQMNEHVSYTGTAVSMYSHTGTHIDALNHFGLNGKIWNGFSAEEHLGDRGWKVTGAEKIPPIIARGVLIDIAKAKGVESLADGYRITRQDLVDTLTKQQVNVEKGDVVLIRTGRMQDYENAAAYMKNPPGLGMAAAKFLVEEKGAMIIGADNLSLEAFPSELEDDYVPLHTYLLAQHGVPIMELVYLEDLSKDDVFPVSRNMPTTGKTESRVGVSEIKHRLGRPCCVLLDSPRHQHGEDSIATRNRSFDNAPIVCHTWDNFDLLLESIEFPNTFNATNADDFVAPT